MKLKKIAAATAAVSLAIAPVAAQAAESLAPAVERIGAKEAEAEQLEGGSGILIAILAAAAIIAGIIIIADDDDPDSPG